MPTGVYPRRPGIIKRRCTPPLERFVVLVNFDGPIPEHRPDLGPCWIWTGTKSVGYGKFNAGSRRANREIAWAHRWLYEFCIGPIPDGLTLDHLCRTRICVNLGHVESVTHKINILRGAGASAINARKTHCKNGHSLTLGNILPYGRGRVCGICNRAWRATQYQRKKATTISA